MTWQIGAVPGLDDPVRDRDRRRQPDRAAAIAARSSSRLNQRASAISSVVDPDLPAADRAARGIRASGSAASARAGCRGTGSGPTDDARLLEDLAADRLLGGLARLRRIPPGSRPGARAIARSGQQAPDRRIGDQHDHWPGRRGGSAHCHPPGSAARARRIRARSARRSAGSARASRASWPARPRGSAGRHPGRTAAGPPLAGWPRGSRQPRLTGRPPACSAAGGDPEIGLAVRARAEQEPDPVRCRAGGTKHELNVVSAEADQRLPALDDHRLAARVGPGGGSATRCRCAGARTGPPRSWTALAASSGGAVRRRTAYAAGAVRLRAVGPGRSLLSLPAPPPFGVHRGP